MSPKTPGDSAVWHVGLMSRERFSPGIHIPCERGVSFQRVTILSNPVCMEAREYTIWQLLSRRTGRAQMNADFADACLCT